MKKTIILFFLIFTIALILVPGCAKRGSITGGVKDTIAPILLYSKPANKSANFTSKKIKIQFNELIKIKDLNKQLIISPPLKNRPIILPQGLPSKSITIELNDTLQPNTTYCFNFGNSIKDNNESNPYNQFKYIFSTGKYIDSLRFSGILKDARSLTKDDYITVCLYKAEQFNDSTIFRSKPSYVTNTLDSTEVFRFSNLKQGLYYVVALKDKNQNLIYDPKDEKLSFFTHPISIPSDTIYELKLFKEQQTFNVFEPKQQSLNKFYLPYQGYIEEPYTISAIVDQNKEIKIESFYLKDKDSLELFIPILEKDNDSIEFNFKNTSIDTFFKKKLKKFKTLDTLIISSKDKTNLHPLNDYILLHHTPIKKVNKKQISLSKNDTTSIDFEITLRENLKELAIKFDKEEKTSYQLQILPNAISDNYGYQTTDTLNYTFKTNALNDYGNLNVIFNNLPKHPLIVELLNQKETVLYTQILDPKKDNSTYFKWITPKKYLLRVTIDKNNNGRWDSGNYLLKQQPEETIYFHTPLEVRANWDVEQTMDLSF